MGSPNSYPYWSEDSLVESEDGSNVGLSARPAAAFYNGKVYIAHQGSRGNSGWTWLTEYDGSFTKDRLIPSSDNAYGISDSPALAVCQGKLHLVNQGRGNSGWIWHATYDGKEWSEHRLIPNDDHAYGISGSPALAVYQGKLHLVNQGRKNSGWIWHATYDGKEWSEHRLIPNDDHAYGISGSPALAVYQGKLHLVNQGRKNSGWIWHATYDGKEWSEHQLIPSPDNAYGIPGSPALGIFNNYLYIISEGRGNSGWLWIAQYDPTTNTWGKHQLLPNDDNAYGTTDGPALVNYRERLYCFHQARGKGGWLWFADYGSTHFYEFTENACNKAFETQSEISYSVGWRPYVFDMLRCIYSGGPVFQYYDPSEIDGVGVLLGVTSGKVYGDQLKRQVCEELEMFPKDKGHYSWVLTPNSPEGGGKIMYAFNSQTAIDERCYIRRHSELTGDNVVCAGEFYLTQVDKAPGIRELYLEINDSSGHYRPNGAQCIGFALDTFKKLGLNLDKKLGLNLDNVEVYTQEGFCKPIAKA